MLVVIDGKEFEPKGSVGSRIGIAITTHNRNSALAKALEMHKLHGPCGALVVVVDDGSTIPIVVPDWVRVIRHEKSQGIVAAKNASLLALMNAGCEHLFLFDDDAYPISDNWHVPYIDSAESHLAYQFLDLSGPRKLGDIAVIARDSEHVAYTDQRGVMLYYKRHAIEAVGGFDWVYGRGMYEHSDLALRIYHAGLNSYAFADVVDSNKLIYSLDEHEAIERSIPPNDRAALAAANASTRNKRRETKYSAFVPLTRPENVVITALLTEKIDPQRTTRMESTPDMLQAWASSIKDARAIVLADHLDSSPAGADLVRVDPMDENPYFLRWLRAYQWLRDNPQVNLVWLTDGTDVEMLREPWGDMDPSKIYVGSEPKVVGDPWMKAHHAASHLQEFVAVNGDKLMLNAGLLGGSRANIMEFIHSIWIDYQLTKIKRFLKTEAPGVEVGDMVTFNRVAYSSWADKIVTGPKVHTVFKTEGVGKETAYWRHK